MPCCVVGEKNRANCLSLLCLFKIFCLFLTVKGVMDCRCAVIDCENGGYNVKKWKKKDCLLHNCKRKNSGCDCALPFVLDLCPTLKNNPERKARDMDKLVNR